MHAHRRQFLTGLSALGLAGLAMAGRTSAQTALASQPYRKIGVQLYTVRDAFAAQPVPTLQKIKDIGFDYVEPIGFNVLSTAAFKSALDQVGLEAPSCHMSLDDLRNRPEAALDDIAAIGAGYAVLAWLPESERKEWAALAGQMNKWAELADERDLGFAYHNHNFEFTATAAGELPYHLLLDNTDSSRVAFELDCYWCSLAGHDPVEILTEHGDRIRLLHLKDKTAGGDMAPVGQGIIDFASVLAKAQSVGVDYVYVEHDNPTDPWASITTSYKNLIG